MLTVSWVSRGGPGTASRSEQHPSSEHAPRSILVSRQIRSSSVRAWLGMQLCLLLPGACVGCWEPAGSCAGMEQPVQRTSAVSPIAAALQMGLGCSPHALIVASVYAFAYTSPLCTRWSPMLTCLLLLLATAVPPSAAPGCIPGGRALLRPGAGAGDCTVGGGSKQVRCRQWSW